MGLVYFTCFQHTYAPVAQGLEHHAYNVGVGGSKPPRRTKSSPIRLLFVLTTVFCYTNSIMNSNTNKTQQSMLIARAKCIMEKTHDPIHDIHHVARVAAFSKKLAHDTKLSEKEIDILTLASWWHDTSRTLTKKPSVIIMPFLDDAISAFLLLITALRFRFFFNSTIRTAIKIIFCKTIGTGGYLRKTLLTKKQQVLADILHDADMLDILHEKRAKEMFTLAESSPIYHVGYKLAVWWFLSASALKTKTEAAKKYLLSMLEDFVLWIKQKDILLWHVQKYGQKWVNKQIAKCHNSILELKTVF